MVNPARRAGRRRKQTNKAVTGMNDIRERDGRAWYLVQCRSRQDERAEAHLLRQQYVCYRPRYPRERLLRGQVQLSDESLFPGYLFIHLGPQDNWAGVRSTRGVSRIVSFGNQPLAVSDSTLAQLRQHCYAPKPEALFTAGDKVRIKEGPLSEVEAIFQEMDCSQRVVLLLVFLQRAQRVMVPLASICRA